MRELVGVSMAWLMRKGRNYSWNRRTGVAPDPDAARTYRLYAAIVLLDIINEVPSLRSSCSTPSVSQPATPRGHPEWSLHGHQKKHGVI